MLGYLARDADPNWFQQHAEALDLLMQHTALTVSASTEIRARELANIAHGVAKSGSTMGKSGGTMGTLMTALARSVEGRLGDCKAQELANIAWAFAKAGQSDDELFGALARVAEGYMDHFNAQEIANTAWAFATAGHSDVELFKALARVAEQQLPNFNMQGLANTAWAFAKIGLLDAQLFRAMAKMALQSADYFNAQDLAHTAWAFAKLGHFDAELFTALARSTEWHLDNFNAQGLANTVWAFAKVGHLDTKLFAALATAVQRRLADFNSQDLANAAWAFAKACHPDAGLFTALARSAEQCLDDFNVQDLVNTAWAFARVGQFDAELCFAVGRSLTGRRLDELNAPQIANIAWAFAKADQPDAQLFTALTRSAEQRVGDFSAQDLASIAWAFANAGQLDTKLFTSLARSAVQFLDDFTDEELDNTEWAFASAGQQKIVKRIRQQRQRTAVAAAALSGAAVDVSKCGRIVVAGGGIGGAAVAVALQSKGFEVVVLETDTSFDARKQGYGLTIQRQDATQAMGINLAQDDAPSTSHYTFSSDGRILGFYGEAFGSKSKDRYESENSGRFVHIPRQKLRARILDQIRPGTIQWNSKLKSFSCWSSDKDGRHGKNGVTVTLSDGTTLDAALLVGSDGIHSTVRRQLDLPGDRLNYVGLVVVLGIVPTASGPSNNGSTGEGSTDKCDAGGGMNTEEAIAVPLTERRIFETVDGTTRIYAMPFTANSTMWQLSFPYDEGSVRALVKDAGALKTEIMRRCGGWHDPIPALLRSTPLDNMSGYPVYDRELLEPSVLRMPPAASAQPKPQRRVTLIGDAAHPMTPFRAQGANQALSDAVLLADSLVDNIQKHGPHAGLDAALPIFEQKMLNRSARMVIGSREKAKEVHSILALQPARKVQRETGVNMQKVIPVLQAKGIGAHNATDPQGLDTVVARAIEMSSLEKPAAPRGTSKGSSTTDGEKRSTEVHSRPGEGVKKRKKETEQSVVGLDAGKRLWGYLADGWHKCVLLKTQKSGKHKVKLQDGTTSLLDADCVHPRDKQTGNGMLKKRKKV
ncbi:hypothetical protein CYMTET_51060 [Cymbomonas tetramitiformis]|uniref:FAD-binding domain-containing protein n=1 Tax=Cymbomonas tetramitiformis TaxID=36881 RepID=A0AAE0ES75_9CHLO|nr:hypothetical protein CYMTET_51060 [Cymbomonas tetramitiformis]